MLRSAPARSSFWSAAPCSISASTCHILTPLGPAATCAFFKSLSSSSSSSPPQLQGRHAHQPVAAYSKVCSYKQQHPVTVSVAINPRAHGPHPGVQFVTTRARAVPDDSPQPAADVPESPADEQQPASTAAQQPALQPQQWPTQQQQSDSQQQVANSHVALAQPEIQAAFTMPQQQQGQTSLQLSASQFRQQLKALLQQQQQLQLALDAAAGLQAANSSSSGSGSSNRVKKRSKLRTAAAGSTDLLLSLLQSQLPVLKGQVPAGSPAGTAAGNVSPGTPPAVGPAFDQKQQGFTPYPKQQQQQQQQQQWSPQPLGRKQRTASGAPGHVPLLAESLNTIAWHCKRQQLLPAEASRLQRFMLNHLLPALAPHLHLVNKRQLARVVYALGSCYASTWEDETMDQERPQQQPQPQQQQVMKLAGSGFETTAGQPAAAAADSAAWVRRLLRLLPPSQLTAGALLAVWQGCALHEVTPSGRWLHDACWVMTGHLQRGKLDFNDTAGLLQACAALDFRPPGWLMVPLVSALQQQLGLLTPADLAGVISSLQDLSYRPSDTWLRVWCEVSSKHLRGMTLDQLAAAAGALAWSSYSTKPWWGRRLTAAALPLLPVATPEELLLLLDSLLSMRLAVEPGWVHESYCHLARQQQGLGLSQLADAAHVLGSMELPPGLVKVHRSWLASCLQRVGGWQGGAAAAALSRSELLYMLYAAARLRVSPGDTLLSASLTRLHRELPAATPAELAGCLSVFIYWWRQQQQQQQQQQRVAGDSSGSSRGRGAAHARSGPVGVMVLLQLRDCLAAVEACSRQFSDEGLLQLLMTCVKVDWAQQQQQQGVCADDQLLVDMHSSIRSLVEVLVDRLPGMSLVQLARVSRTLENGPGSSSSSTRVAWGGSSRPNWYDHLLRQVKAALASRA